MDDFIILRIYFYVHARCSAVIECYGIANVFEWETTILPLRTFQMTASFDTVHTLNG